MTTTISEWANEFALESDIDPIYSSQSNTRVISDLFLHSKGHSTVQISSRPINSNQISTPITEPAYQTSHIVLPDYPLFGYDIPRIYTPPLTPDFPTSGPEVIDWVENVLNIPLLGWQKFIIRHSHELLPDGSLRFKSLLILIARQNGKTTLMVYLALFWLTHGIPMILASSSLLDTAKESWELALEIMEERPDIFGRVHVRRSGGQLSATLVELEGHPRFKCVSATRKGGRGLSGVHRTVQDELREQHSDEADAAVSNTTLAVAEPQDWMLSNAGTPESVVLNKYRALGLSGSDPTFGMFEYSAPEDCELGDFDAWRAANPALGHTISPANLLSKLGKGAKTFRVENLCISDDGGAADAVPAAAWDACADPGTLGAHRAAVALCVDLAPDLGHVSAVAAAVLPDGRVRVETVGVWPTTAAMRKDLPSLVAKVRPRKFGWFANSPAKALEREFAKLKRGAAIPAASTAGICMALAELIKAGRLAHSNDAMLAMHILGSKRRTSGEGWVFDRKDGGHCDGAYAAAGAVHLARTLPQPAKLKVVSAG
jgi:hypothetical protein